jgi:hypothetical protein
LGHRGQRCLLGALVHVLSSDGEYNLGQKQSAHLSIQRTLKVSEFQMGPYAGFAARAVRINPLDRLVAGANVRREKPSVNATPKADYKDNLCPRTGVTWRAVVHSCPSPHLRGHDCRIYTSSAETLGSMDRRAARVTRRFVRATPAIVAKRLGTRWTNLARRRSSRFD